MLYNFVKRFSFRCLFYKKIIVIAIVVLTVICTFAIQSVLNFTSKLSINLCWADLLINAVSPGVFGLFVVPVSLYITSSTCSCDLHPSMAVQYHSRRSIWSNQIALIMIAQIFWTLLIFLITIIGGMVFKLPLVNWTDTASFYYYFQKSTIEIPFQIVAMYSIIYSYLFLSVLNFVFLFLYWSFNRPIICWLVSLVILVNEAYGVPVFRNFLSINYSIWSNLTVFWINISATVFLIGLVVLSGWIIGSKKEFV